MDEMHTFEHTKLKLLSVPVVMYKNTQLILGFGVGHMRGAGKLAKIASVFYSTVTLLAKLRG